MPPAVGLTADANSSPLNGSFDNGPNDSTATTARRRRLRETPVWNLDGLLRPLARRTTARRWQPKLLPHYAAITEFIFNHRFATASQVRERFAAYMRSRRTAQYQMACLVQLGYLDTAPVRSTSPNFPSVYFVTGRGVSMIAAAYEQLGRGWHGSPTENAKARGLGATSVIHELFLTEFSLALERALQHRPDIHRVFSQRRYFTDREGLFCEQRGRRVRLVPDLGVMLQFSTSSSTSQYFLPHPMLLFLEMDRGTMPMRRVAEKINSYAAWNRSEGSAHYLRRIGLSDHIANRCDFRLLWVAHAAEGGEDGNRVKQLLDMTSTLPRSMRDKIWITSVTLLRQHTNTVSPLLEAIWLRPASRPPVGESLPFTTTQPGAGTLAWRGRDLRYRNLLPLAPSGD